MGMFKNEVQEFRHRGFKVSLDPNEPIVMIFGDGPEPQSKDGNPIQKMWDHDISQVITVKDHVE